MFSKERPRLCNNLRNSNSMKTLAMFLLAVFVAAHVQAQPHYLIQAITSANGEVSPNAINDRGQVTGTLYLNSGGESAFFYSAGQVIALPAIRNNYSNGYAINNHGQIVGGASGPGFPWGFEAFFWSSGAILPISPPNGTIAYGINNTDVIVGGPPAFVYQGGVMTDLGLGTDSVAYGINNAGAIVGNNSQGSYSNETLRAFIWKKGKLTILPTLGGTNNGADAINNKGHVMGTSQTPGDITSHTFFYAHGQLTDIEPAPNIFTQGEDLNDKDQIVGVFTSNNTESAFLWERGVLYDLNSLIDGNSGWVLLVASGVNNQGQITGVGRYNGVVTGFLLTPY